MRPASDSGAGSTPVNVKEHEGIVAEAAGATV
jgi:hypothetical protein